MEQLSFQGLPVLGWLFESTIYISILICLIFIIKALTKKKLPAWWSYCLWLLLLVRMLIPFGVETPVSVYNYVPAPPENSSYMPYLEQYKINIPLTQYAPDTAPVSSPDVVPAEGALAAEADKPEKPIIEQHATDTHEITVATDTSGFNLSLDRVLLLFWLSGVLAFGIATVYKNCRFWLVVRRGQQVTEIFFLDLFNECKSTLGLQRNVEIIETDSVKSPAIFGYIKPQLLLPPQFLDTLNTNELHCIFMHELGHVKRHDIGIAWLATLFQVIYWFNPLVWYAFHHLRADQEAACDEYVLSKIKQVRPTYYAKTIVNLLERFIQNRQLPSLAGIIENKSQIDRRISMILNYKRITLKMTLVSVLMLLFVGGVFFACSNGKLSNRESTSANITRSGNSDKEDNKSDDSDYTKGREPDQESTTENINRPENSDTKDSNLSKRRSAIASIIRPDNSDMKRYKNDDWNFSLNIPQNWDISPSLPSYLAPIKGASFSFGSNDDGLNALVILMLPHDPELSLDEEINSIQKQRANEGLDNFITTETTVGSRKALLLDFDKKVKDDTLRAHAYLIPYKSSLYILGFVTTRPDPTIELYDRIAETFEFHEAPVVRGIKKYVSSDGCFSQEIPFHWIAFPPENKNEIVFGSPENGVTAVVYHPSHTPGESLEDYRNRIMGTKIDSRDITNSETVINGKKTLIADYNNGFFSIRAYFFEDGDYKSRVAFFTSYKDGIPSDKLEEYDRAIRSYTFRKKPAVVGMKEYTDPDNKILFAFSTKRYISPDGEFTVDLPHYWRPFFPHNTEKNEIGQFGTSEEGLKVIFYSPLYSPLLTLEERCNVEIKDYTKAGYTVLSKSETVINGRKVLIYDLHKNTSSYRKYYFKEGDYIYSVLFYAFNTDNFPTDRVEESDKIMKSFNILNATPRVSGTKEDTGPDLEKSMVTSIDLNIAFGYDDNDYPITNEMIKKVYEKHDYILHPPEPAIFFKDKDSRQVIFMELETDFHRFYIYHFYENKVPDELIQKFQAIAKDNNIKVDVPTKFKDLIKNAYIIDNKYFTTKLNFRLGMSSKEAISIYGEPTKTIKNNNSTKFIWDYRNVLNGKIHSDPKKGIILGKDITPELVHKVKWGYLLEITFSNNKASFIKMYNGIP